MGAAFETGVLGGLKRGGRRVRFQPESGHSVRIIRLWLQRGAGVGVDFRADGDLGGLRFAPGLHSGFSHDLTVADQDDWSVVILVGGGLIPP